MKINPNIFRGYDLRGKEKDLSEELFEHLGKAHGTLLRKKGITKAIVGFDSRKNSKIYSEASIRGLRLVGINVISIGMTLVGNFYWAQYFLKAAGGMYITASHNPAEYNGVKFADDYSSTLVSEGIQAIRKMVEEENYVQMEQGTLEKKDILNEYIADMNKRITIDKKFKVVVDAGNATAGVIVPKVLRSFGLEVIEYNCNIDSSFPLGTADPTEKDVAERLRKEVLEEKADLGFTYDADSDRIGIVDDKGTIIWNDVLVALFAIDVLHDHPKAKIMFNTLCSKLVSETIISKGGKPFMWRTGHSFLKNKNKKVKAAFIGELSGHFFFSADFYNHDDGIYSSLKLLNYLSRKNISLSSALKQLPQYISSPEIKLGSPDDKKVSLISEISKQLKKDFQDAEIIDDERAGDGVRLEQEDSMFVIRYSQNGPYITIKFEAKTQKNYDKLQKYISKLLHNYKDVDWSFGVNVDSL